MAMDPKQERALRDGTASVADEPRDTDIDSVREQAENPPVGERPRPRRRTAAVADARVNHEAVASRGFQPTTDPQLAAPVAPREDRMPRDIPKARDDRSAPKGNVTAGQDDRNPNLETRDDQRPGPPSRAFSLDAARDAAAMPNAAPRPRPIAKAKRAVSRPRVQARTRAASARGAANRAKAKRATTKRAAPKRSATKRTAPRKRTAAKRPRTAAKRPATRAKRKR